MNRLVKKRFGNQRGITGIETAIILIAFVIVASVFAYVVLSAGLFSTQKAKEAIHAGLEEATAFYRRFISPWPPLPEAIPSISPRPVQEITPTLSSSPTATPTRYSQPSTGL
jgi:flagellin-like protein